VLFLCNHGAKAQWTVEEVRREFRSLGGNFLFKTGGYSSEGFRPAFDPHPLEYDHVVGCWPETHAALKKDFPQLDAQGRLHYFDRAAASAGDYRSLHRLLCQRKA